MKITHFWQVNKVLGNFKPFLLKLEAVSHKAPCWRIELHVEQFGTNRDRKHASLTVETCTHTPLKAQLLFLFWFNCVKTYNRL